MTWKNNGENQILLLTLLKVWCKKQNKRKIQLNPLSNGAYHLTETKLNEINSLVSANFEFDHHYESNLLEGFELIGKPVFWLKKLLKSDFLVKLSDTKSEACKYGENRVWKSRWIIGHQFCGNFRLSGFLAIEIPAIFNHLDCQKLKIFESDYAGRYQSRSDGETWICKSRWIYIRSKFLSFLDNHWIKLKSLSGRKSFISVEQSTDNLKNWIETTNFWELWVRLSRKSFMNSIQWISRTVKMLIPGPNEQYSTWYWLQRCVLLKNNLTGEFKLVVFQRNEIKNRGNSKTAAGFRFFRQTLFWCRGEMDGVSFEASFIGVLLLNDTSTEEFKPVKM